MNQWLCLRNSWSQIRFTTQEGIFSQIFSILWSTEREREKKSLNESYEKQKVGKKEIRGKEEVKQWFHFTPINTKADLLKLKLIHLFAREDSLVKKLEIEETKDWLA